MRTTVLIGIIGVLVGVVVTTEGRTVAASPSSMRTFTVLVDRTQTVIRDLGSTNPRLGDFRAGNSVLLNATGTKTIGRVDIFSIVTQEAGSRSPGLHLNQSIYTFNLPGGTITGQSLVSRMHDTLAAIPGVGAITGGTGTYMGARGQYWYSVSGNRATFTFRLLS